MKSIFVFLLLSLFSYQAYAGPDVNVGKVGEAKDVQKVIRVQMYDNYFKPAAYKIKQVKQ